MGREYSGMVQDIFRNHFGLGNNLKSPCWVPKLVFFFSTKTWILFFYKKDARRTITNFGTIFAPRSLI